MVLFQVIKSELSDGDIRSYKYYQQIKSETDDRELRAQAHYPITDESKFTMTLFGRSDSGLDVCCHVTEFTPQLDIRINLSHVSGETNDQRVQRGLDLWQQSNYGERLLEEMQKKLCRPPSEDQRKKGWQRFDHFVRFGEVARRKSNYGFRNGEEDVIVPVLCQNLFTYSRLRYFLDDVNHFDMFTDILGFEIKLVDKDVIPITRFWGDSSLYQVTPCAWYEIEEAKFECIYGNKQSLCDIEITVPFKDFAKTVRTNVTKMNPHIVQAAIDIETYTKDRKNGGINPLLLENPCFCIGITTFTQANGFIRKIILYFSRTISENSLRETYERMYGDLEIFVFTTEQGMLEACGRLLQQLRPDVLSGYNSDQFDYWYLFERAKIAGCGSAFYQMGKIVDNDAYIVEESFSSRAKGDATYRRPDIAGVFCLDAMIVISADVTKKFSSYSLKFVSTELLGGETKYDLAYEEMFALYEGQTVAGAAEIAHYCIQDVIVTQKVVTVDSIVNKLLEMSNLMLVDILWLVTKGQTVKCVSSLYSYYAKPEYNYYFDNIFDKADKLAGGHVEEPIRGYYSNPTIVLDFKSLYPSIMIGRGFDFSSAVLHPRYTNLPNVEYYQSRSIHPLTGEVLDYSFAKKTEQMCVQDNIAPLRNVIPDILRILSDTRQQVKKQMQKLDKKSPEYLNLDSKQNAIKVSMNSFFGFVGGSKFPLAAYAQSITGEGRNMLAQSKLIVETSLPRRIMNMLPQPPVVIYGDSVTGNTPILLQMADGTMMYRCIDDINPDKEWVDRIGDGKQYKACPYKVWTDKGFVTVTNVIRHKTNKKLYRVRSPTGIADVTEDHSLLSPSGEKLKPGNIRIGSSLLHVDLPNPTSNTIVDFDEEYAWVMGFFYADGSCEGYTSWALNNQEKSLLQRATDALERHEGGLKFKILETMKSSGVYKLVANSNKVNGLAQKWGEWFYDNRRHKIVPVIILNADFKTRLAFFKGYYAGDGELDFDKGKIGAAGLIHLVNSLNYSYTLSPYRATPHCYHIRAYTRHAENGHLVDVDDALLLNIEHLTLTDGYGRKKLPWTRDPDEVISISMLPDTVDYVYDLTTENGHFGVGPGRLIVSNTDSVFVNCPGATEKQAENFGKAAGEYLTSSFACPPIEMEYEKTLVNLILINRKNYVYSIRNRKQELEVIFFGGEQVKRDYCAYFQQIYKHLIQHIFFGSVVSSQTQTDNEQDLMRSIAKLKVNDDKEDFTVSYSYLQYVQMTKKKHDFILNTLAALSKKTQASEDEEPKTVFSRIHQESGHILELGRIVRQKLQFLQQQKQHISISHEQAHSRISSGMQYVKTMIQKMIDREIDLSLLCETSRLAATYDSPKLAAIKKVEKARVGPYDTREWAIPNKAAVKLARRIKTRSPGEEPAVGERFSFLKVIDFDRSDKKADQVETLDFVVANKVPIDVVAYLDKDGRPFEKLFAVLGSGLVFGHVLDDFKAQATKRLNEQVLLAQKTQEKLAMKNFFSVGSTSAAATPVLFNKRQTKATASSKAKKKTDIQKQQNKFENYFIKVNTGSTE